MKKVAKVAGLLAGAFALIWAMRDRFISVAASREPEPPTFRSPIAPGRPIDTVEGIGPVFAGRLRSGGIDDVAKLAAATPDVVAEAAGVSVARARAWIDQARDMG